MPNAREPLLKPVPITELRPTQITVGLREVNAKRKRWRGTPFGWCSTTAAGCNRLTIKRADVITPIFRKLSATSLMIRSASHGASMDTSHLLAERQKTDVDWATQSY